MTLKEKIEEAFRNRSKPDEVYRLSDNDRIYSIDSDIEKTLWFSGRDWRKLSWDDWQKYYCAIFFFLPEAFAYYLPSIMITALERLENSSMAADSILHDLDRSPGQENWDLRLTERYLQLDFQELEAIEEWMIKLSDSPAYKGFGLSDGGPGDFLGRAFDTITALRERRVEMMKEETQKRCNEIST